MGAPVIEGCELDCECKGLDLLPLLSPVAAATDSRLAPAQRLKLTGSAHFAGRVTPAAHDGVPLGGSPSFAGARSTAPCRPKTSAPSAACTCCTRT